MKQVQLTVEDIRSRFQMKFKGADGNVYAAPGRINLIGEHTDYNGGYVFPGAVDKGMVAEVRPNGTDLVRAFAIDLYESAEFDINDKEGPKESWARYIYGICQEMKARGVDVKGFDTAFSGDVPLGSGMSSSAALESCYAFAINDSSVSTLVIRLAYFVCKSNCSLAISLTSINVLAILRAK